MITSHCKFIRKRQLFCRQVENRAKSGYGIKFAPARQLFDIDQRLDLFCFERSAKVQKTADFRRKFRFFDFQLRSDFCITVFLKMVIDWTLENFQKFFWNFFCFRIESINQIEAKSPLKMLKCFQCHFWHLDSAIFTFLYQRIFYPRNEPFQFLS